MNHQLRRILAVLLFFTAPLLSQGPPTDATPSGSTATTAAGIDTALQTATPTQEASIRASLAVGAVGRAAFYDNFSDLSRYPEGATVTDGVTLPQVGAAWQWKKNDGAAPADIKMFVANGGLRAPRLGGGYLAAQGTPEDRRNFNFGFEFTREDTRFTEGGASGGATANFTVTVGAAPLTSGSTHNAWGRIHANVHPAGINSIPVFQAGWNVTVDPADDTLTLGLVRNPSAPNPPPIETGDFVVVEGTLPAGVPAGGGCYAIKISPTVYKLAATRALALAGTALNLTTTGSGVILGRQLECTNRPYDGTYFRWQPRRVRASRCSFSASTDFVTTTAPHGYANDSVVVFEGDNLAGGLTGGVPYYVRNSTLTTFQVATAPGGTPIDLTTNGGADQYVRGAGLLNSTVQSMPHGRRNLLIVAVRGDYMDWTLVGVGTITYYFRDLAYIMGASGPIGFYWQVPPESSSGLNFPATYALHAAWIDAPFAEESHIERFESYLSTLNMGTWHELPGRLWLTPPNGSYRSTMLDALSSDSIRAVAVARGLKTLGTGSRPVGGHWFAEGLYLSNPFFNDAGSSVIGVAPATIAGIEAAVSSAAASSTTNIASLNTPGVMETGEFQEFVICGTLVGTNAKRIQLVYQGLEGSGNVFDSNASGAPLDAFNNVPFVIRVERIQSASVSHLTYATMTVNGTTIGPQRLSLNVAGNYRALTIRTTTADAGGVVVDLGRTTIHRTKPQY